MPKLYKYIVVVLATTGVALFAAKKEKPTKPVTTKPGKGEFIVNSNDRFITCPRVPSQPEMFTENQEDQKPYDHCAACRMGVFFPREDGKMSCSYCENILETVTVLP